MFDVGTSNESVRVKWIKKTLFKIPAGLTILDAETGKCQFKIFCSHLKYIDHDFAPFHFACGLSRFFYESHLPLNGFTIEDLQLNGVFLITLPGKTEVLKMWP
jgi:hypothetical protein